MFTCSCKEMIKQAIFGFMLLAFAGLSHAAALTGSDSHHENIHSINLAYDLRINMSTFFGTLYSKPDDKNMAFGSWKHPTALGDPLSGIPSMFLITIGPKKIGENVYFMRGFPLHLSSNEIGIVFSSRLQIYLVGQWTAGVTPSPSMLVVYTRSEQNLKLYLPALLHWASKLTNDFSRGGKSKTTTQNDRVLIYNLATCKPHGKTPYIEDCPVKVLNFGPGTHKPAR